MLVDKVEPRWVEAFFELVSLCKVKPEEQVAILCESQSRELNIQVLSLALARTGAQVFQVMVPTPPQVPKDSSTQSPVMPVRSTGASVALRGQTAALAALKAADVVFDLTVEGLLHAIELPEILAAGTRVQMISNEHPDALERLVPKVEMKERVKSAIKACRSASTMHVTSKAGTDLHVDMKSAATAGVWGWTDRPGTIAHWPGGVLVSFPSKGTTNGKLVLDKGDINLTFKRYLSDPVVLTIENDFVTDVAGDHTDGELLRRYFAGWKDENAYAVSHVGWGLNPDARYEALSMYDQRDTNGTELRCYAGNFLFSTGANEFAGRFTKGHFDIPVRGCTIKLDDQVVVDEGQVLGLET